MLVIQRPDGFLCDREALSAWSGRSPHTIRSKCPVADRTRDGRPLYNAEQCLVMLEETRRMSRARAA